MIFKTPQANKEDMNQQIKKEIHRLKVGMAIKIMEIVCLTVFGALFLITGYEYYWLHKDPNTFRILILLMLLIQSK